MSVTQDYNSKNKIVELSYPSLGTVISAMQTAQSYYIESHELCARTQFDDFWTSRLKKLHVAFREIGRADLIQEVVA